VEKNGIEELVGDEAMEAIVLEVESGEVNEATRNPFRFLVGNLDFRFFFQSFCLFLFFKIMLLSRLMKINFVFDFVELIFEWDGLWCYN